MYSQWVLERVAIGEVYRLVEGTTMVGRVPTAGIRLRSVHCSRRHCEFHVSNNTVTVEDYSTNGTFVNREQYIHAVGSLLENDRIGIGCIASDEECAKGTFPIFYLRKQPIQVVPRNEPDEDIQVVNNLEPRNEEANEDIQVVNNLEPRNEKPDEDIQVVNNLEPRNEEANKDIQVINNLEPRNEEANEDIQVVNNLEPRNEEANEDIQVVNNLEPRNEEANEDIQAVNNLEPRNEEANEDIQMVNNLEPKNEEANEDIQVGNNLESRNEEADEVIEVVSDSELRNEEPDEVIKVKNETRNKEPNEVIDIFDSDDETSTPSIKGNAKLEDDEIYEISDCDDPDISYIALEKSEKIGEAKESGDRGSSRTSVDKQLTESHTVENIGTIIIPKIKTENEIADEEDELMNIHLSQSVMRDIKQEIYGFELEESFETKPFIDLDDFSKFEYESEEHKEIKPPSPMFNLDHDDEYDNNEIVSKWAAKLSQTFVQEINETKTDTAKRKLPQIIQPPSLPTKKGKHRGVSANLSSGKHNIVSSRKNDKKAGWKQNPNLEKQKEKVKSEQLKEERKQKLKEIGNVEASKRKLKDDDEVKVMKKVKVKITTRNRGAFLAEFDKPKSFATKSNIKNDKKPIDNEIQASTSNSIPHYNISTRSKSLTSDPEDISLNKKLQKTSIGEVIERRKSAIEPKKFPNLNTSTIKTKACRSIFKPPGSAKIKVRKVRFNDTPIIHTYERDINNVLNRKVDKKDASIDMSSFVQKTLQIDYTEHTLSNILSWDPKWLETKKEEVNGSNHILLPMFHQFQNMDDFTRILFPLMKLELWASFEQEVAHNNFFSNFIPIKLKNYYFEQRRFGNRIVHSCEVIGQSNQRSQSYFCPGDISILEINKITKHFAFIKSVKISDYQNKSHYEVIFETSLYPNYKEILEMIQDFKLKSITQIRVDLGAFNAVHNLKFSPLHPYILNPYKIVHRDKCSTEKLCYKGYDELNDNQKRSLLEAYYYSIDSKKPNISMIEGPPGTGKSRLIANLTIQLINGNEISRLNKKILICSQSNTAIDVIALKLLEIRSRVPNKFRLVRFGILEKIHPYVRCVSVQKLIIANMKAKRTDINWAALKQERIQLETRIFTLSKHKNDDNVLSDELRNLKKSLEKLQTLEKQLIHPDAENNMYIQYLNGAQIVCTTLSSCIKLLQYTKHFDICIIDESTQCQEPWTLIPLQFGISSLILVGDTQQLPATVLSRETKECGLGKSLFTRMQKCFDDTKTNPILSLNTQYRMHPDICQWPNTYFYKNRLMNDSSTNLLQSLIKPYTILSLDFDQNNNDVRGQISNDLEGKFIIDLITNISELIPPKYFTYGIITPYAEHRDMLSKLIEKAGIKYVTVNTIDSYQGKEKDVIIISNARTKGVGFLSNYQRLNVAMTRARKCLVLCGNFSSLEKVPVWKSLLSNAKERKLFYHITKSDALNVPENVMSHLKLK